MRMPVNLPIQLGISAPHKSRGLPAAKPGQYIDINLTRFMYTSGPLQGVLNLFDPIGIRLTSMPFRMEPSHSSVRVSIPLRPGLLAGNYTVAVNLSRDRAGGRKDAKEEGVSSSPQLFSCFRVEGGYPPIASSRLTYQATVANRSSNPIDDLKVFVAVPPSLPPYQEVLDLKVHPSHARQANDLTGNSWVHLSVHHLPPGGQVSLRYTALLRNHTIRYRLSPLPHVTFPPGDLQVYTKPEWFIESHHHLIKDMANSITEENPEPEKYVPAAMKAVAETLQYAPQKEERGAAYAIEHKVGDCTEYAALLAALCRARGIPARLQAGFGSDDGRNWERHAWAQVWIRGRWIPVDPTWHGRDGLLGTTSRAITLIIGNWMSSRIRQELVIRYRAKPGTPQPHLSTSWKIDSITPGGQGTPPPLSRAPRMPRATITAMVPDAVPRGSRIPLTVGVEAKAKKGYVTLPIPVVLTASLHDGEVNRVVALHPLRLDPQHPTNLRLSIPMPLCAPRVTLTLILWRNGRPVSIPWSKIIGLI